jgi:hypothetical protein
VTFFSQGDVRLSQRALAGGIARYIMRRSNATAETIRAAYLRQCGRDPEDDHSHFIVWLKGWAQTVDLVGKR